jgi:PhnB protein
MRLNPHLNFNGQCEAAFKFYEHCFGGKILTMATYDSTPAGEQVPAEWRKKLMHAELMIGDQKVMGADPPPGRYEASKGFSLTVEIEQPAEADRIFAALAENANVTMPIQQTFWAARFGMLVDQFGIPWMVNCAGAAAAAQSH